MEQEDKLDRWSSRASWAGIVLGILGYWHPVFLLFGSIMMLLGAYFIHKAVNLMGKRIG